ncbi:MAG: DUF2089 domain-containing protein [Alicyclobacillaceae bacterium]|nr:DUF2089 domain-containing protein [Alicyclobacillaceae bacterium]
MPHTVPFTCPACRDTMHVSELTCSRCQTKVRGQFQTPALFRLTPAQLRFVEAFLRCRGDVREVIRELNIAYPEARSQLDGIIEALGYPAGMRLPGADAGTTDDKDPAPDLPGPGDLSFAEALRWLREGRGP